MNIFEAADSQIHTTKLASNIRQAANEQAAMQRMLTDLFRKEALVNAQSNVGTPAAFAGVSSTALTIFLASLAITAMIFASTASYARK